ncbi:MAG: polymerase, sigma subunit, SigW [Clostridia bacterium]|nr:polymerase, sigma subunit, SigW [Clostridia bacterium]
MKDEEIITLILQGKSELYSILIDRYSGKIFSTAYSYTHDHEEARDLVQEILIKVYNNLAKFKADSKFSTWLYRVAVNSCIDWNRKSNSRILKVAFSSEDNDVFDTIMDESDGPEQALLNNEHKELIRSVVKQMPEIYKTVLILYYFEDLKIQEISNVLDCPKKTVETRLYRAKGILKAQLKQELSGGDSYELQTI